MNPCLWSVGRCLTAKANRPGQDMVLRFLTRGVPLSDLMLLPGCSRRPPGLGGALAPAPTRPRPTATGPHGGLPSAMQWELARALLKSQRPIFQGWFKENGLQTRRDIISCKQSFLPRLLPRGGLRKCSFLRRPANPAPTSSGEGPSTRFSADTQGLLKCGTSSNSQALPLSYSLSLHRAQLRGHGNHCRW